MGEEVSESEGGFDREFHVFEGDASNTEFVGVSEVFLILEQLERHRGLALVDQEHGRVLGEYRDAIGGHRSIKNARHVSAHDADHNGDGGYATPENRPSQDHPARPRAG